MNGRTYKPTQVILTDKSFNVYTPNLKASIKREDFAYRQIMDHTDWTTILVYDKLKNIIPISCSDRTVMLELIDIVEKIEIK